MWSSLGKPCLNSVESWPGSKTAARNRTNAEIWREEARSHRQASRAHETDQSVKVPRHHGGQKRETSGKKVSPFFVSRKQPSKVIKKTKSEGQSWVCRRAAVESGGKGERKTV